jgi:hypothetical protein
LSKERGGAISHAGFGAVIAWLRDDPSGWDPINLWRVKTIVRHAFSIAFLCLSLVPIYSFTQNDAATIRIGSAVAALYSISDMWRIRRPDPLVWEAVSWRVFMATSGALALFALGNVFGTRSVPPGADPRAPYLSCRDLHQFRPGNGQPFRVSG